MDFLEIIKKFTDRDVSSFNDFKFKIGADISPVMMFLAIAFFCVFIYLAFRSTKELKSVVRRTLLIIFRSIALAFILLIVFQPAVELRETKKIKKSMAVLFDDSLSMSLKLDKKIQSRHDNLKKFIVENKDYFKKLGDDFNVDYYMFGSALKNASLEEFLKDSGADQPRTMIGEALEELGRKYPMKEYSDVMLFTDGSDNGKISGLSYDMETELDKNLFSKYIKSLNVKIHPVACGGGNEDFADIAVKKVIADKFGFIRTPFEIGLDIRASGLDSMTVPITLKEGNNIIKTESIVITKDEKEYHVRMKFYPQKIGKVVYTVSLPTYDRELIHANNEKSFFVNIIRDKTRVLFVVGTPTWDERFLRRTLKSNPNIDLISFMILRTSYDYLNVPENEMSLIPFPTKEIFEKELHTFDVIIFCNFDYAPYTSPMYLNNIMKYIIQDGGGFLMIGGDRSFMSGRYLFSAIKDILPVEMSRGMTPYQFGKFKPVLTEVGASHPILRVDYDEENNRRLYESLPALEGMNSVLKVKDDAVALMTHPKVENEHGPAPVIAISEVGKGRSMAITTDTLWRWNLPYAGEGGSTRIYDNFWHNALKWLVKDPDWDLVKISLTDTSFSVNEPMLIKLKVLDHKYQPARKAEINSEVKNLGGNFKNLIFEKTDIPGEYTAKFVPEKEGIYMIEASAATGGKLLGKDFHPFIVEDSKDEYANLEINFKLLNELAKISETGVAEIKDGKISGETDIDSVNEELLLGKIEITFWDSKLNFLIIIIFLILEWHIRRRYGLY